jgi:hypothetical protein
MVHVCPLSTDTGSLHALRDPMQPFGKDSSPSVASGCGFLPATQDLWVWAYTWSSPWATATTDPPTRTSESLSPREQTEAWMWLGRPILKPCLINSA